MPYTINRKNDAFQQGFPLTIPDNQTNSTSTSLNLLGRGVSNYGESVAENFVRILENFADTQPPANPLIGQLWMHADPTVVGSGILKIYKGGTGGSPAGWEAVGGLLASSSQPTTPQNGNIWFNTVTKKLYVYIDPNWVEIPLGGILGSGLNAITALVGTSEPATPKEGDIWYDLTSDKLYVRVNNAWVEIIKGVATVEAIANTIALRDSNAALTASEFKGVSVSARYADVAERYEADAIYEPGTVVVLGGEKEITVTTTQSDINAFGVISTNPALRMNSEAGSDETHPFVALSGRIPVKVVGSVKKGQRLVTSVIEGVAVALDDNLLNDNYPAVIGRALESKDTDHVGLIMVVVGVK